MTDEQHRQAEQAVHHLKEQGHDVKTEVTPADTFWPAESYHQDYLKKHPHH